MSNYFAGKDFVFSRSYISGYKILDKVNKNI